MNEIVLTCSAGAYNKTVKSKHFFCDKKRTGGCVEAPWARCGYSDDCDDEDDEGLDRNHLHTDWVGLDAGKASQLRHE